MRKTYIICLLWGNISNKNVLLLMPTFPSHAARNCYKVTVSESKRPNHCISLEKLHKKPDDGMYHYRNEGQIVISLFRNFNFYWCHLLRWHAVVQLVEALRYKAEGSIGIFFYLILPALLWPWVGFSISRRV